MPAFEDLAAERGSLAGIFRHGRDGFIDVETYVSNPSLYSDETNQFIFACAQDHYKDGSERPFDWPSLLSASKRLGFAQKFSDQDTKRHVAALIKYPIELETVKYEAAKILKLSIGRELNEKLVASQKDLHQITGEESLAHILGIVENPIFEFSNGLATEGSDTKQIGQGVDEWLEDLIENPRDSVGIPSPFPRWNRAVGGGYRRRNISMLFGRRKSGKTHYANNVCLHAAGTLGIPVLNVDTEMSDEEHWGRILAHLTNIPTERIELGQLDEAEKSLLRDKAAYLKDIPYYYRSVIDESFEEQVAAMRRWIIKTVGHTDEGVRKNCLVLYDYLHLADKEGYGNQQFKEYQLLGFHMVALSRMVKRYDVPLVALGQLNREGGVSGSDRIEWKCANLSVIEPKSAEEIDMDGVEAGNLKLKVSFARQGEGLAPNDYINLKFEGATARLTEGKTRFEIDGVKKQSDSFPIDDSVFEAYTPWESPNVVQ